MAERGGKAGKIRADRARVANENAGELSRAVAPFPMIDRFPSILGSNLTLAYMAAVWRICQNGFRQQLVDALDELLEKDPHAFAVLTQRVLGAIGRVELTPADVPADSPEAEKAKEIRDDLQRRMDAIPSRAQAFASLVFAGLYYGAGALEVLWDPRPDGWWVRGLSFVHSRRLAAPDQNDFAPHVWDQGSVSLTGWGTHPTSNYFGIRIVDWPGKFIFHAPQTRADYWLREGLGRVIGWWMAIKLMAIRGAGDFVERYAKPWALGYYNTGEEAAAGKPRAANEKDIQALDAAIAAVGSGSLTGAALPDSVKVELDGPAIRGGTNSINHEKLIALCDEQVSKAVRGGTLTTDAGEKGARSLGEVHELSDVRNARYDAACLADTLGRKVADGSSDRGLVWWLCHLNHPGFEHLCPSVAVHVEKIDPAAILARAKALAEIGAPVDGKKLSDKLGVDLVDPNDPDAIRLAPLKPVDLFALLPTAAKDVPAAVEALAAIAGISLPPAVKSAIAEMDRDDAARLVQGLIGAAKANEKAAADAGAGAESAAPQPQPSDTTTPQVPGPVAPPTAAHPRVATKTTKKPIRRTKSGPPITPED